MCYNNIFIYSIIILFFSCRSRNYETQYYENGNVKIKSELKNGLRDGLLILYYPDGHIKSKQIWKNGEADGTSLFYFENGQLETKLNWDSGKLNGSYTSYYETGELHKRGYFLDSLLIDTLNFFYKDGKIMEQHFYGKEGNLRWYKKFSENGDIKDSYKLPLFIPVKDTISISDLYKIKIKFFSNYYELKLVMEGSDKDHTHDTINAIGLNSRAFYYECSPKNIGDNFIKGKLLEFSDHRLKEETSFTHHYYVVPN